MNSYHIQRCRKHLMESLVVMKYPLWVLRWTRRVM